MNGLGVVLETARRARGWTQEKLADESGVTQEAISRYERGLREPDDETIDRLATALNLTSAFLKQAGRVRGAVAVDAHMRRRKTAKPSEWKRLEAQLNMHRLHARRVFDEIAVRTEQRVPSFDPFETDPVTAARLVRSQWRMPTGPVRHLVAWMEAAGCLIIEDNFGVQGIDGLSQWIDEIPIVLVNSTLPTDRKRWTLAHELGHLCLHTGDASESAEEEADKFASEFLIPRDIARPQLRRLTLGVLMDLKREWAVSMQALIEAAWRDELISVSKRTSLYKGLSVKGWRQREPFSDVLGVEHPTLAQEIGRALAARGLSAEEVAHVVGFRSEDTKHPFVSQSRLRAL